MTVKKEPVKITRIEFICPTTNTNTSVPLSSVSFRAKMSSCIKCGDNTIIDLDVGLCPACNRTHPVTILRSF